MIATNPLFKQLVFGNTLNIIYSVLLLLVLALLLWRWFKIRQADNQWHEKWRVFHKVTFEKLREVEGAHSPDEIHSALKSADLADLSARVRAHMELPTPELTTQELVKASFQHDPSLNWQLEKREEHWAKMPGIAILLGLLGTFFGLTAALTQLPFKGGLAKLSQGLQNVLPLMGTAFWTSVCGLIASLLIRAMNTVLTGLKKKRTEKYQAFTQEVRNHVLREVYPRLATLQGKDNTTQQTLSLQKEFEKLFEKVEGSFEGLTQQMGRSLEGLAKEMSASLAPVFAPFEALVQRLEALPNSVRQMQEEVDKINASLNTWQGTLGQIEGHMENFSRQIANAVEPIAHTEKLLNERLATLSRQNQAMQTALERIESHESALPEKMREMLKLSLRPAYLMVQRSTQSIHQLFEQQVEQQSQERKIWRQMLMELGNRFEAATAIAHTNEKLTQELTGINETLIDVSTRLRFQVQNAPAANEQGEDPLEEEIEQMLESFNEPG